MQKINLRGKKATFTIMGADVAPPRRPGLRMTKKRNALYWSYLAEELKSRKLASIAAGLDSEGRPMKRIRPITRRFYRDQGRKIRGGAMASQGELSRTYRYLQIRPFPKHNPDRVIGFWLGGFAQIVGWHARGEAGRGRPILDGSKVVGFAGIPGAVTGVVRNIVGMPEEDIREAVAAARRRFLAEMPEPEPRPRLTAEQRRMVERYPVLIPYIPTPAARPRPR